LLSVSSAGFLFSGGFLGCLRGGLMAAWIVEESMMAPDFMVRPPFWHWLSSFSKSGWIRSYSARIFRNLTRVVSSGAGSSGAFVKFCVSGPRSHLFCTSP